MSTTSPAANPAGNAAGNQVILDQEAAQRGFSRSVLISGIRCTLTYIVLPFVAPFIGLAPNVGPVVGLVVGTIAMAANLFSIRRFWRSDHRYKVPATVLHTAVLLLLTVLMVIDVRDLLS